MTPYSNKAGMGKGSYPKYGDQHHGIFNEEGDGALTGRDSLQFFPMLCLGVTLSSVSHTISPQSPFVTTSDLLVPYSIKEITVPLLPGQPQR